MALDARILDTSIISRGAKKKIDLAKPVGIYTSLRADKRAQSLADLTLTKAEKAENRKLKFREIMQGSLNEQGQINSEKAMADLHRGGFTDEAFEIQERMVKAETAQREKQKSMSRAFLTVSEADNPVEAFLLAREQGVKNNWQMSEGLMNYMPTQEEIQDGGIDPKVMEEMKFHGERFLTPQERIARAKATGKKAGLDEYGLSPIYGERGGQIVALQTSKRGGVREIELPEGVTLSPGIVYKDLGNTIGAFDKAGNVVANFEKGIAPGKRADLVYKGIDAEIKRSKEGRDVEAFQAKRVEIAKKARAYAKANRNAIESVEEFIDKAEGVQESTNLGGITGKGKVLKIIPGSRWADLNADMDFLVSSGVINTMRELKEKSPTGSTGFGALSEKEMGVLENAFSTLSNRNQSPQKMKEELGRIITKMKKSMRILRTTLKDSKSILGPEKTEDETLNDEIDGL